MNYEEIVNSQELATHREQMPVGEFYKKLIDKKYRNVVELKPDLADSLVFCDALRKEQKWASTQTAAQQMHYELHEDSSGIYELELEQGNYQTLAQLLTNNPAAVTGDGFIDNLVGQLLDYTDKLHQAEVLHLCYAPQNIFVRKGDNMPLLLCHGSFYQSVNDVKSIYKDFEDYMAPEVLAGEKGDERSDIYGLGKLIEYLFDQGSMPFEYKRVVQKATAEDPEKRFRSVGDMKSALANKRNARHTLYMFLGAMALTALAVVLYIELVPPTVDVEYVEPVPQEVDEDPFDYHFDPATGLLEEGDSMFTEDDLHAYQQKAEEIFRKRFTAAADEALSKVYDNKRMGASEKTFMAGSQSMMQDLIEKQTQMGEEAGLTPEQSGKIAQEIIETITTQKQAQLSRKGYIKESQPGEGEEEGENEEMKK